MEYVSFHENPEETKINITNCTTHAYYDWSHDCKDGILDLTKCMEGNTTNRFYKTKISIHSIMVQSRPKTS